MFETVKRLAGAFGVSGNEDNIREIIKAEISGKLDEVITDTLGNLIGIKRGKGKKIMLAAHMDEIGVIATFIDDKGFVRFSSLGWVSQYYSLGQRVKFENGTSGAVFYEQKLDDMKSLKLSSMYIDIGAKSREEASGKIKIGMAASFENEAVLEGDMIISKALDDRCGCAVLVELIKNLPETDNELYFVFTVQEELGLRGAKTSAYSLMPDIAIAVDVTDTGDTPECAHMELKCGAGPAIKIKDTSIICHRDVKLLLEESAKKGNIPVQYEILDHGGSDPGAIHLVAGGIPSGAVSIPCRYIHSPVEMVSLKDLQNAVLLLKEAVM